jgi:hypothetical protein
MRTIYQFARKSTIKIVAIFALLFFTVVQAKAVCPVTADFTYQKVGNIVTFTPVQQADTLVYFNWSFGDNNYSNQTSNVVNTYINAGNYIVRFQVYGRDPIDTSIRCNKVKLDTILIEDSIPCEHKNSTINTTLYFPNNNIGVGFCADYNNCLFLNSFTIIGNAFHGNISENGSSCFLYQIESVGVDTIKIISCNTINNCDTTTHIINVLQRSECNRITDDTIRLEIQNGSAAYCSPFVYDRYFVLNNNSYYGYSLCSPNNLQLTFNTHGFYNITIIDSTNNCFENVVFDVIDSLVIQSCATSSSFVLTDTFYNNDLNIPRAYCLPLVCQLRRIQTQHGVLQYGNLNVDQNGCILYIYTSFGSDSFYITLSDSNSSIQDTFYFYFFGIDSSQSLCDTTTCLLPGDADHDFTVNNYDALAIGLSYNRIGVARPDATTQYTLQACDDWNTTHYYGYNDKFADCNGDGIINSSDALVIDQNYIVQAQNQFNHRQSQLDSLPSVTLTFDTLPTMVVNGNCDGAELVADINVGSADQPLVNGYGIAFSVDYPFDNDSCFSVSVDLDPSSWFQTNNPVLLFYKNIPQYNRVDVSVVRTDGLPRTGNGRIGRIKMITEGGIFRGGRLSSNKIFDFSVSDVAAINQIGQRMDVNGSSTSVNFVVAGVKQNKVDGLKIFPNPTNSKLFIHAKENIASIKIIDLSGRIINEFLPYKNDVELDFSTTENGMYIIEIKGKNSVSYEKVFKQ